MLASGPGQRFPLSIDHYMPKLSIINRLQTGVVGVILLLALTAYYLVFRESPVLLIGLIILVVLVGIIFARPELGLPALIFVRPLVDSIGEYRVVVGNASINVAGALSLIAISWGLWILIRQRARLWEYELFRSILLFFIISTLSLAYSWTPGATLTELLRILSFFVLFLAARATITGWIAFRRLALAFAGSLVIPAIVGFGQVLSGTGLTFAESINRAYGTFGHPNVLAFYLVLGISFLLFCWPMIQTRLRSRWPVIIILATLLVLTFTRGAWLGMLLALGVMGIIHFRRLLLGGLIALVVIVAILPTVNVVTTDVFGVDLRTVPGAKEIIARQADPSSYQWRLDVWTEMSRRFYERPVFGFGLGAFLVVRQLQVYDFFQGVGAHNDYLRLLIELGLLGVCSYILFLASIFVHLGRKYRQLHNHPLSLPILSLISFSAAFVIMSVFDNLLQSTPVMWAYLILLGAVLNLTPKIKTYRSKRLG